jgi:hypothetical protein
MLGEIEPLKQLQDDTERSDVIERIVGAYPVRILAPGQILYRARLNVKMAADPREYDAPPLGRAGNGRLDSSSLPVLYASEDLHICIHECRATAEDDIFVGTLSPTREIRLLNLAHILDEEESTTEFDSLDLSVAMLFLAGPHSYHISRAIALAVRERGFDGVIYPSYFSMLRTGSEPFETAYGIAYRRFAKLRSYEEGKVIENVAIFDRPVQDGRLLVRCINRVMLRRVDYELRFGPAAIPEG